MNITEKSTLQTYIDLAKKNIKENDKLKNLILPVVALACGVLFLPNTAVGIATGIAIVTAELPVLVLKGYTEFPFTKIVYTSDRPVNFDLQRYVCIFSTVIGPIREELMFRGFLQTLLSQSIVWLIPTASAPLFGPVFSVGMVVSIVATAIFFGFAHGHSFQTDSAATLSGIAYGALAANFGLRASLASHMTHNTIIEIVGNLFAGDKIKYININHR